MKQPIQDRFYQMMKRGEITRQRAYQLRHLAEGKCVKCDAMRATKNHCLRHAIYERNRQRDKMHAQDERPSKVRKLEREFVPPPLDHLARE